MSAIAIIIYYARSSSCRAGVKLEIRQWTLYLSGLISAGVRCQSLITVILCVYHVVLWTKTQLISISFAVGSYVTFGR